MEEKDENGIEVATKQVSEPTQTFEHPAEATTWAFEHHVYRDERAKRKRKFTAENVVFVFRSTNGIAPFHSLLLTLTCHGTLHNVPLGAAKSRRTTTI